MELIHSTDLRGGAFPVSARDLHERLEISTHYKDWFPRMAEYEFVEGVDFNPLKNEQVRLEGDREVLRKITDHYLTIGMAKEICMLQRSERGREVRRYLISLEEQWNSPEAVMSRALSIADRKISELTDSLRKLEVDNSKMRVELAVATPKAEYFDALVDRGLNLSIRESAKELQVKESVFVNYMLSHKYLYRNKKGKLMPYAHFVGDLFELKEFVNEKTSFGGTQTLLTPKGRETFRVLFSKLN